MTATSELAIRVEGLRKRFGSMQALDDVTFDVRRGEVLGYLGPNGAGKTTTIRVLLDLIRRDAGTVEVLGADPRTAGPTLRGRIGYLPGEATLWDRMTGHETIARVSALRGRADHVRAHELAERFDLDLQRQVRTLSKGNRQKVLIVLAFMHDPDLVILDEPTSGLDPLMQREFHQLLQELTAAGQSVLISSHVMDEVERVADRVAVIRDGAVVTVDTVEHLRDAVPVEIVARFAKSAGAPADLALPTGARVDAGDVAHEIIITPGDDLPGVLRSLADHDVVSIDTRRRSLEEAFLEYYASTPSVGEHGKESD